jgi:hypothetical protein
MPPGSDVLESESVSISRWPATSEKEVWSNANWICVASTGQAPSECVDVAIEATEPFAATRWSAAQICPPPVSASTVRVQNVSDERAVLVNAAGSGAVTQRCTRCLSVAAAAAA